MNNDQLEVVLTIVIANYNYGRYLGSAIWSIVQQCDEPVDCNGRMVLPIQGSSSIAVELMVCDAASTDNSLEIVKQYKDYITWWCSEPDSGQSEAFNKGFKHGQGKYITWLNADEQYLRGTLLALAKRIKEKKCPPWITGNHFEFYTDTNRIRRVSWGPHFQPSFLTGRKRGGIAVFGPSSFIRRDVFEEIGPIDESLQYTMDLDYWTRLNLAGFCQTRLNRFCWAFGVHPQSKSTGYWAQPENTMNSPGQKENIEREGRYDYHYQYRISNPWYCLWLFFRIIDGSLLVRAWKRFMLPGRVYDLESCAIL